jgi:hypothetical protein
MLSVENEVGTHPSTLLPNLLPNQLISCVSDHLLAPERSSILHVDKGCSFRGNTLEDNELFTIDARQLGWSSLREWERSGLYWIHDWTEKKWREFDGGRSTSLSEDGDSEWQHPLFLSRKELSTPQNRDFTLPSKQLRAISCRKLMCDWWVFDKLLPLSERFAALLYRLNQLAERKCDRVSPLQDL